MGTRTGSLFVDTRPEGLRYSPDFITASYDRATVSPPLPNFLVALRQSR